MAALQQCPAAFQSLPPPKKATVSPKAFTLSFSSTFAVPSLTLKLSVNRRRNGGGAMGARMSDEVADNYALALAQAAEEDGTLDLTSADVEKIDKIFSDPDILGFFSDPLVSVEDMRSVLDDIIKEAKLLPTTANFLNILIDEKRIELIQDIIKEFEVAYNKLTDTELAVVASVVPLENQHLAQLAKQVQKLTGAKNVRIKTEIDPSLVAGFTIRYGSSGSKLIDMSVRKQLEEIAADLELGEIQLAPV